MGFIHYVALIFVIAKIWQVGEVADWSWWLVLSPVILGAIGSAIIDTWNKK